MLKKNGGITLIALVITIIVLLILAGVSIAMLSGDNGILSRASQASVQNELGAANDAVSLFVSDAVADYYEDVYVSGNTAATTTLTAYLESYITNSKLASAINNSKITVKTPTANNALGTGNTTIELTAEDSKNNYTSTGTLNNGKVTWVINKTAKTE